MMELKYSDILKLNNDLEHNFKSDPYKIAILSNISVYQIKEILECSLRIKDIYADVEIGNYNNIVQDSIKYKNSNLVIIFWELLNIVNGLQYKIELYDDNEFEKIFDRIKSEINFVLRNLDKTSLVIINKFTPAHFYNSNIGKNNFIELANKLNQHLEVTIPKNVKLIKLENIFSSVGLNQSIDMRFYHSSQSIYTINFYKTYTKYIEPYILSLNGKAKKALIFDCDNTLWKGILGEIGINKIEMSPKTKDGAIFAEIQSIALSLSKKGVLIGLCSKNNFSDVEEVLMNHPDMLLKDKHITFKKVNWLNKVTNLKNIAQELNISLDSMVFVDDSPFETNLVKNKLKEVTVIKVPELLYDYPGVLREISNFFYNPFINITDKEKIKMYKQQANRIADRNNFVNIEDYLKSLEMKLTIYEDNKSIIARTAQLSQKTNQFNLTTKRYTEKDIIDFVDNKDSKVITFSLSDRYGNSGITGLAIINFNFNKQSAEIDTFLMSCRIIGRNIEYVVLDNVVDYINKKNIKTIKAKYVKNSKNEQVKNFYDNCSFSLYESKDLVKNYSLEINKYNYKNINYIQITNGG